MKLFRMRTSLLAVAAMLLSSCAHQSSEPAALEVGRVEITTAPLPPNMNPRSATYTASGRLLVSFLQNDGADRRLISLATMDDDGRNLRTFFSGRVPDRPKDNGIRYMVFADNQRIFMGDFILECTTSLETCNDPALVPVTYPAEIADGPHVAHRWSEMIIAPDNRHVAWTTLLSDYSALMFTGALERDANGYRIVQTRLLSTLEPFAPDPAHADGVIPQPPRTGEVKQFVHGGAAISLVGAVRRDTADSVIFDLASGNTSPITDSAGYTETTIVSPDGRLGLTMTSRFSSATDLAILGLMPRPYPDSLNMGLNMNAYAYSVTGVRRSREGSIGPALIEIDASSQQPGYTGRNLNTDSNWVFGSPISWAPDSRRGAWMEARRGETARRIQIVRLPDYHAGPAIAAQTTPDQLAYASSDLSVVQSIAQRERTLNAKVYGRHSGYIQFSRSASGEIVKVYSDFSDDGESVYNGSERMLPNPSGNSIYIADIRLTGPHPGRMDVQMTFGPLNSELPSQLIFTPDETGAPRSRGYAEYDGQRVDVSALSP